MCKPHLWGIRQGCHPVSRVPARPMRKPPPQFPSPSAEPAAEAEIAPVPPPARSPGSRRSPPRAARPAQVCQQQRRREGPGGGAPARRTSDRREERRAPGRRDALTRGGQDAAGAEQRAAQRGQHAGLLHAAGFCLQRRTSDQRNAPCAAPGINQAGRPRPPGPPTGHVLLPRPAEGGLGGASPLGRGEEGKGWRSLPPPTVPATRLQKLSLEGLRPSASDPQHRKNK
jgi:hypothetical protein